MQSVYVLRPYLAEKYSMAHEVFMPALGMTQDTGRLVKWHKSIGEKVSKSEIIMEVETDKSTMEVEAGSDGFVAEILAEEGEDIPVGDIIAIITSDGVPRKSNKKEISEKVKEAKENPSQTEPKIDNKDQSGKVAVRPTTERILASPKAKVYAQKQGISLIDLRNSGVNEPYHFSDVLKFSKEPETLSPRTSSKMGGLNSKNQGFSGILVAEVEEDAFLEILDDLELHNNSGVIFSCFASAAYRSTLGAPKGSIIVECRNATEAVRNLKDPDLTGFREAIENDDLIVDKPNIIVRDLTSSYINSVQPVVSENLEIWVTRKKVTNGFILVFTLGYNSGDITSSQAILILERLVTRVNMPLYHLI